MGSNLRFNYFEIAAVIIFGIGFTMLFLNRNLVKKIIGFNSNPVPAGLVLTGIVVSVSVTAVLLALTVRLYLRYRTLELDEIIAKARTEDEE